MIRHLRHRDIDRARWDETISTSPQSLIYGYSWYLDLVAPGWEALVTDDYSSVMPLTFRKKMGVKYLFVSFSAQQLGIFSQSDRPADEAAFLAAIPREYRYIDIRFNREHSTVPDGFERIELHSQELDLTPAYDAIRSGYSSNLKRNIRKAEKQGCLARVGESEAGPLIAQFQQSKGQQFQQLGPEFYQTLERIFEEAGKRDMAEVWDVVDGNGELLAANLVLKDAHRRYLMLFVNTPNGRTAGAMHLLIDSVVKKYAESPLVLDFEGSNDPGLAKFNLGFGSKDYVYLQLRKNNLPRGFKWIKP